MVNQGGVGVIQFPPCLCCVFLEQHCMACNGLLYFLRLDADVTLGCGGAGVLQKALYQGYVITAVLIDLGRIPLPEAVSADAVIAQVIANDVELFLHRTLSNGEDDGGSRYVIPQAVVFDVLLDNQRDGKRSLLTGLLLHDV